MPLIEKFSRDSDDDSSPHREWGSGRTPDSDASVTPTLRDDSPRSVAVDVYAAEEGVRLRVDQTEVTLSRAAVRDLRAALGAALADRREFVHTAGHHREDGAYVVERRGADSAGHRKVFDSFRACQRLYETLPTEFVATDLDAPGVSGGRRHMLAWHFVEHPAFDCTLLGRQPLTVRKSPADGSAVADADEVPSGDPETLEMPGD